MTSESTTNSQKIVESLCKEIDSKKSTTTTSVVSTITNCPRVALRVNEYGIFELLPQDCHPKPSVSVQESILSKQEENDPTGQRVTRKMEIVCCKQCDGYGIADEFVDKHYCSEKCRRISLARLSLTKSLGNVGRIQAVKRKSTAAELPESSSSSPDSLSMRDRSATTELDKEPDNKAAKSFSWSKYLERRRAQAAPERLFTDPFPYCKHGFRPGMKLEGIDPEHQSLFCVLTVAEVQGYRLRLHFDGYSDSHDFWVNADSENIFPAGWCEKNGQKLQSPKNYDNQRPFNWSHYLKHTGGCAAPRHLFLATQTEYPIPSAFRIKMKLEAVDRRHSSHTLCVATVANVLGTRFLVHFDGWDAIYDYWADPSCPYVHPVGWSKEHNMALTPPCDYDGTSGEFSWDRYLAETGSSSVPPRAFKPRSPVGFKTGMKLECVDPRNPQLIRVATVAAVKGYRLKIHFDGWSTDYDFWTDDDWPDLHPPGWCSKTGHPLQPPLILSLDSTPVAGECPTSGCYGAGHIEGSKYTTHNTLENCPYSSRNLQRESPPFPDRLVGEEGESVPSEKKEEIRPIKFNEPKIKTQTDTVESVVKAEDDSIPKSVDLEVKSKAAESDPKPKTINIEQKLKIFDNLEPKIEIIPVVTPEMRAASPVQTTQCKKIKRSYFSGKTPVGDSGPTRKKSLLADENKDHVKNEPKEFKVTDSLKDKNSDATSHLQGPTCSSQVSKTLLEDVPVNLNLTTPLCWPKHISLLSKFVESNTEEQVAKWSIEQVGEFISKFGLDVRHVQQFLDEQIDGEAFLQLTQSDLVEILNMKLGPAIKIQNVIWLMKNRYHFKLNF